MHVRILGASLVLTLASVVSAQTFPDPTSCLKNLGVAEGQMPTIEQLQKCAPQPPAGSLSAPSAPSSPATVSPSAVSTQSSSCPNLTRTLQKGSRGTDVTQLQNFLIARGDLSAGNNTGYFGALTESAVQKFQCSQSIVCSGTPSSTGYGLVGAKTRAAIQRSCSGTTTTTTSTNTASSNTSNSSQSLIDQLNAQIKQLQERLAALGNSNSTQTSQSTQGTQTTTQTTQTTTNASCSFNNQTVAHGASVTAYQSSSVASGQTCQSQTRTCSNGTLSGTYAAARCTVETGQLSSAVITSQVPTEVGEFALYARNSPRYVQAGSVSYVALNITNTIYIYRRSGSGEWKLWQQLVHDYHRAPSLFVSNDNRLHVLSESATGAIGHRVYTGVNTESPQGPYAVDTTAWGSSNYYIGGAYNPADNSLYLCATYNRYDGNEYTKCGAYTTTWNVIGFQSYTNHVYLYPNMHPDLGGGFWLDMGAYPLARGGAAAYASHVRTLNAIWRVNSSLGVISGGAVYGSTALGKTYFANDVAAVPGGGVATFPVTTTYQLDGRTPPDSNVYSLLSSESFAKQYATGLTGSAYTAQTVGGKIYLVGAGRIASSSDGKTWTTSTYEIPGFPTSEYTYGVAQTLQAKGGGTQSSDLRFIQELTNKSDLRHTIVEVRMPL